MGDPYDALSSELYYDPVTWVANCGQTLAEAPEWSIITQVYPELRQPPPDNSGPTNIPFAFTEIDIQASPPASRPLLTNFNIELGITGEIGSCSRTCNASINTATLSSLKSVWKER